MRTGPDGRHQGERCDTCACPGQPVRIFAVAVAFCVGAVGCTSTTPDVARPSDHGKGTIVVGVSGAFTENQLVAEMYARVLEHAGYTVQRQFDLEAREVSQTAL